MSHDPIHDWLDMACGTLLGDKKAKKHYKEQKEKNKRRANRRYEDDGESLIAPGQMTRQHSYGGSIPSYPEPWISYAAGQPRQPMVGPPRRSHGTRQGLQSLKGSSLHELCPDCNNPDCDCPKHGLYHRSSSSPHGLHRGINHGSHPPSQHGSPVPLGSLGKSSVRVRTSKYPVGDMTRTYIEGMVPADAARKGRMQATIGN